MLKYFCGTLFEGVTTNIPTKFAFIREMIF